MAEPKKKVLDDQVNAKIQQKFDLIFSKASPKTKVESTVFNDGDDIHFDDDFNLDGESSMSSSAHKKNSAEAIKPNLDLGEDSSELEFGNDSEIPATPVESKPGNEATKLAVVPDDSGLEFNLDFGDDTPEIPPAQHADAPAEGAGGQFDIELGSESVDHFEMDSKSGDDEKTIIASDVHGQLDLGEDSSELDTMFDEAIAEGKIQSENDFTQKTVIFDKSQLTSSDINDFESESTGSLNSSADLMSSEEAKANIDATIKDIIRPKKVENTQEFDLSSMTEGDESSNFSLDDEPSLSGTPSVGFNFSNTPTNATNLSSSAATGEFDLSSVEFADKEMPEEVAPAKSSFSGKADSVPAQEYFSTPTDSPFSGVAQTHSAHTGSSLVSDEDSSRFQATIRQLREEREVLLGQVKMMKGESRELEQDNLTLKAALDESKIEVSILRKRHMVELEDMRYRLSLNEEKKALAIEQAKVAESKREKLEQRVRIDFNQVKQREKELETKLEMLSIDVDSQVQSRDQKILELRRKIDALEFNMENVSIKEQRSQDDKRKLEDKLNKIMKTLRHSIKNLEDDIDQANDEVQDSRTNDTHRLR